MNIVCSICTDIFNASANISSTPCGHLFHNQCLNQWLERSPRKTCPQCRSVFDTTQDFHKIYLNVDASSETSFTNFGVLQQTNDDLKFQLNVKTKEIKDLNTKLVARHGWREELCNVIDATQAKIRSAEFVIDTLKEKARQVELKIKQFVEIDEELNKVNTKLHMIKLVGDILDSTAKEAEEIIKRPMNAKTLAVLVATLKEKLRSSETRRKELTCYLESVQNECNLTEDNIQMLKKQTNILKTRNEQLMAEIEQLKTSTNQNDINREPKPEVFSYTSAKRTQRGYTQIRK